ncbi:MAG: MFS transporter [Nitrospiraceae bacterium]|nr:MAG: MFS transporter [Nitrospiraceae bacterium]
MRFRKKDFNTLAPFLACSFLLYFTNWMIMAFLPVFLKSISFSDSRIGIIIGIFSVSSLLMILPAGFLSDYLSPKKMAVFGASLFFIYTSGLYSVRDFYPLLGIALTGGFAHSILNITIYSLFLKVMGIELRGKKIAFYQVGAYLGFGGGPLIGGWIVHHYSFESLFLLASALSFFLIILSATLKDRPGIAFDFKDYKIELKDRKIFLLIVIILVYATHFGVEQTSLSLFMKDTLLFSGQRIGLVFFILGIWMAILAPIAGHSFDRSRNIIRILLIGLMASGLFQIATGYVSTFTELVFIRVLHTMGDALIILTISILTSEFFPVERLGGHSGVLHISRTVGIFLGNIGSGYTNELFDYNMSLIINGTYIFIFAVLVTGLVRKLFVLK